VRRAGPALHTRKETFFTATKHEIRWRGRNTSVTISHKRQTALCEKQGAAEGAQSVDEKDISRKAGAEPRKRGRGKSRESFFVWTQKWIYNRKRA